MIELVCLPYSSNFLSVARLDTCGGGEWGRCEVVFNPDRFMFFVLWLG